MFLCRAKHSDAVPPERVPTPTAPPKPQQDSDDDDEREDPIITNVPNVVTSTEPSPRISKESNRSSSNKIWGSLLPKKKEIGDAKNQEDITEVIDVRRGHDSKATVAKLCLVNRKKKDIKVSAAGLAVMRSAQGPARLIAIVGASGTAKSWLANYIIRAENLFPSKRKIPVTEGIDISPVYYSLSYIAKVADADESVAVPTAGTDNQNIQLAFLDTEGLGSSGALLDTKILTPVLLCSSIVLYNVRVVSPQTPLEGLIEQLSPIEGASIQADRAMAAVAGQIDQVESTWVPFGHLHVLVRDWSGEGGEDPASILVDEDENDQSPPEVVRRNTIRRMLKEQFVSVKVHGLPRSSSEWELSKLETLPLHRALRDFSDAVGKMLGAVVEDAVAPCDSLVLGNRISSGSYVAECFEQLVAQVQANANDMMTMNIRWVVGLATENELYRVYQTARSQIQLSENTFPMSPALLNKKLALLEESIKTNFNDKTMSFPSEIRRRNLKQLLADIEGFSQDAVDKNQEAVRVLLEGSIAGITKLAGAKCEATVVPVLASTIPALVDAKIDEAVTDYAKQTSAVVAAPELRPTLLGMLADARISLIPILSERNTNGTRAAKEALSHTADTALSSLNAIRDRIAVRLGGRVLSTPPPQTAPAGGRNKAALLSGRGSGSGRGASVSTSMMSGSRELQLLLEKARNSTLEQVRAMDSVKADASWPAPASAPAPASTPKDASLLLIPAAPSTPVPTPTTPSTSNNPPRTPSTALPLTLDQAHDSDEVIGDELPKAANTEAPATGAEVLQPPSTPAPTTFSPTPTAAAETEMMVRAARRRSTLPGALEDSRAEEEADTAEGPNDSAKTERHVRLPTPGPPSDLPTTRTSVSFSRGTTLSADPDDLLLPQSRSLSNISSLAISPSPRSALSRSKSGPNLGLGPTPRKERRLSFATDVPMEQHDRRMSVPRPPTPHSRRASQDVVVMDPDEEELLRSVEAERERAVMMSAGSEADGDGASFEPRPMEVSAIEAKVEGAIKAKMEQLRQEAERYRTLIEIKKHANQLIHTITEKKRHVIGDLISLNQSAWANKFNDTLTKKIQSAKDEAVQWWESQGGSANNNTGSGGGASMIRKKLNQMQIDIREQMRQTVPISWSKDMQEKLSIELEGMSAGLEKSWTVKEKESKATKARQEWLELEELMRTTDAGVDRKTLRSRSSTVGGAGESSPRNLTPRSVPAALPETFGQEDSEPMVVFTQQKPVIVNPVPSPRRESVSGSPSPPRQAAAATTLSTSPPVIHFLPPIKQEHDTKQMFRLPPRLEDAVRPPSFLPSGPPIPYTSASAKPKPHHQQGTHKPRRPVVEQSAVDPELEELLAGMRPNIVPPTNRDREDSSRRQLPREQPMREQAMAANMTANVNAKKYDEVDEVLSHLRDNMSSPRGRADSVLTTRGSIASSSSNEEAHRRSPSVARTSTDWSSFPRLAPAPGPRHLASSPFPSELQRLVYGDRGGDYDRPPPPVTAGGGAKTGKNVVFA